MTGLRVKDTHALWTAERLRHSLATSFGGESIVVLANREPFKHEHAPGGAIVVKRSGGGLVTALEPILNACSGVWVAHGAGSADKATVDWRDGVDVPGKPGYRLRRVWLSEEEERGYYFGFANEGLWPLCHTAQVRPAFRRDDFYMYAAMNARFAEAVCDEVDSESPLVLVQDYHFALAPAFIRECLPQCTIVAFWHIPWPDPRQFDTCPWGCNLLEGLLASSIVGLQTPLDCRRFVETVEYSLDARVDRRHNTITHKGHTTMVRVYPVSVEWPGRWVVRSPSIETCRETVRCRLDLSPDTLLGVGVDRLDYTKGINEKFLAIERMLESFPEFRERFVFVQIAEPSRDRLPAYRDLRVRVQDTRDRINRRFGTGGYRPIVLLDAHHDPDEVYSFLRAADLCYVNSLHDGMNLVAKEFVCARDDGRGVLVLSSLTGAAQQLTEALIVNPYATDDSARTLAEALRMADAEQAERMHAMRSVVAEFNSYWWAGRIAQDAARLREMRNASARSRNGSDCLGIRVSSRPSAS